MNPITLLVPAKNAAEYLPRLFSTVTNQCSAFEACAVYDDGSTDQTARVAAGLGAKVLQNHQTSLGPGGARNALVDATTGPWIHFHDADDALECNFVTEMTALLDDHVDVLICQSDWIDQQSGETEIEWRYRGPELESDPISETLLNPISVICTVIRRSTFLSVGGFDTSIHCWEDSDLFVRLALSGARFRVCDKVLVKSYRTGLGVSSDQRYCWNCRCALLRKYIPQVPLHCKSAIAEASERAMAGAIDHGDETAAKDLFKSCHEAGICLPRTRSVILRALMCLFGFWNAFRLQRWMRS